MSHSYYICPLSFKSLFNARDYIEVHTFGHPLSEVMQDVNQIGDAVLGGGNSWKREYIIITDPSESMLTFLTVKAFCQKTYWGCMSQVLREIINVKWGHKIPLA